jgi:hypothetical protein
MYSYKILTNNGSDYKIHIFERNIDDTVYTFCNFAFKKQQLSKAEFQLLFERARTTQLKYHIPSYSSARNFSCVHGGKLVDDVISIAKIIEKDIYLDNIDQRIIGIDVPDDISYSHVVKRDRQAEKEYTREYLYEFNHCYKNLFKYLDSSAVVSNVEELSALI